MPPRTTIAFRKYKAALEAQGGQLIRVNLDKVFDTIRTRTFIEVARTQEAMFQHAKAGAPVRKVFANSKKITNDRYSRFLTKGEAKAEQSIRKTLNAQAEAYAKNNPGRPARLLSTKLHDIQQIRTLKIPSRGRRSAVPSNPLLRTDARHIKQPEGDRTLKLSRSGTYSMPNERQLNSRGRYELRRAHLSPYRGGGAFETREINPTTGVMHRKTTLGGRLKGEIRKVAPDIEGQRIKASVESPTYYARFVEFGTRHAAAQPYMRPALAFVREDFRKNMRRALVGLRWK